MAKKNVIGGVNWDASAFMASEAIAKRVKTIHDTAIREASTIAVNLKPDPDKVFSFDNYPQTKQQINKVFADFANKMTVNIKQGNTDAFAIAHAKNDTLLDYLSEKTKVSRKTLENRYSFGARNQESLSAFQTRKENGLGLSDRVWKISTNARKEIEFGIDLGLEEGMDASKLSRKVRENLNDPNKLFRRVRDKHGNLKLSQSAKEFSPGQGVYRSSYKNAMRLTRTEVNMAYRTADYERWSSLDFIAGIEVKLSGSPSPCHICESLKGKYPKTFKFVGWHPQCRCFAVPILPTADEYDELELKLLNEEDTSSWESSNIVKTVPKGFVDWIDNNKERAKNWKSMPYFVRDNFKEGDIKKGLKFDTPKAKKVVKSPIKKAEKIIKVEEVIPSQQSIEDYWNKYESVGTHNIAKKKIKDLIPMADKIEMGSKVNKANIPNIVGTVDYLSSKYIIGSERLSTVKFSGGTRYHGMVQRWHTGNIKTIDFGSTVDRYVNRKRSTGSEVLENLRRGKSAVDEKFNSISTIVHEWGHVMATNSSKSLVQVATGRNAPEFFDKLNDTMKDYHVELKGHLASGAKNKAAEMYLGRYASFNLNEFMAEGFTEYTLSSKPSKYALKIGNLIDEYFKK